MISTPDVLLIAGAFWTLGWVVGLLTGRWTKGEKG